MVSEVLLKHYHDFMHVNSREAGKYNKHQKKGLLKQRTYYGLENGSLGFIDS